MYRRRRPRATDQRLAHGGGRRSSSSAAVAVKRRYESAHRQQQARQTRRVILNSAAALFVEPGYAATPLTAIAAKAGVAIQTVYKVFGSKQALLSRWSISQWLAMTSP
jgi:hypothetical protein